MEYVQVDGSQGEGGGQILRTAVAFSAILGRPVRVDRIRAGRDVPGLKRQHVAALKVIAGVFGGELRGATEGSSAVAFAPGKLKAEAFSVDTGTAASVTLVLQAVVPAVALSGSRLKLDLVGGTDVPWSPTFDYFERVAREAYGSVGMRFGLSISRRGYYPAGGGRVMASIEPSRGFPPIQLTAPQPVTGVNLVSRCARLPRHVAERQLDSAAALLEKSGVRVLSKEISEEQADSPGSSILAYHVAQGIFLGSDGIGARGKPAEEVGREAAEKFVFAAKSGARLDSNLADMVLPLLSLAPTESRASVPAVTSHLSSGMQLASRFTGCRWSVEEGHGRSIVTVTPRA